MPFNYKDKLLINGSKEVNEMLKAIGEYCEHLEKTNILLKEKLKETSEDNETGNTTRSNDCGNEKW